MLKKIFTLFFFCMASILHAAQDQSGPPPLPTEEIAPLPSSDQLTESYEGSFMRVILSLLGLVVLVIMTFWILKRLGRGRFGKFGSDKNIHIIERRPLSPKSVLYLVEIGNKRVLLSESQLEVRSLTSYEISEKEEEVD